VDDNIFHTSTEGKVLENPKNSALNLFIREQFRHKKLLTDLQK